MELKEHLMRQIAFSRATFGPGRRTEGVIDHIHKELVEVEQSGGSPSEWVDVVILALDGLTRALIEEGLDHLAGDGTPPHEIIGKVPGYAAHEAVRLIRSKQSINEMRNWPDRRTAAPNKAIEHNRSKED